MQMVATGNAATKRAKNIFGAALLWQKLHKTYSKAQERFAFVSLLPSF